MTCFGNGAYPVCWIDNKKKTGIQAKHQVEQTKTGNAMNTILDIPIRSVQELMRAVAIVKMTPFILPTKEGMREYNLLVQKVAEIRAKWAEMSRN